MICQGGPFFHLMLYTNLCRYSHKLQQLVKFKILGILQEQGNKNKAKISKFSSQTISCGSYSSSCLLFLPSFIFSSLICIKKDNDG
uniref:Uncharacterized protein n=1 Tax=Manihot esculenta TaxID=3983 RepID=A0A2C9V7W0_MANES